MKYRKKPWSQEERVAVKQGIELAIQEAVALGLIEDTGKRCVLRDGTIGIVWRKTTRSGGT